jgi:hypothetical protein
MNVRARRVWSDAAMSAGALAILLAVLISIDERVREQVGALVRGTSASTPADAGHQLREVASVLFDAAQTQSVERAPLMIFVVAATVLVLWMLRT